MAQPIEGFISLVDLEGQVILNVFEGVIQKEETYFDVNLGRLPSGVYFFMYTTNEKEINQNKIIKQ